MRRLALPAALLLCALLGTPGIATADPCANEQLRSDDNSLKLPDCRAYEQVSPAEKNSADASFYPVQASTNGEKLAWLSTGAFAGVQGTSNTAQYMSAREAEGWVTRGISPPEEPTGFQSFFPSLYPAFSSDLSQGVLRAYEPALAPGAPPA